MKDLSYLRTECEVPQAKLRPRCFLEFFGQSNLKEQLWLCMQAAKNRDEPMEHLLLSGAPGLGKTSLAYLMASELGTSIKTLSGPAIAKTGDLAAILTHLQLNEILFIDEVHRLSRPIEELLYSAMEDRRLDLILGEGPMARTVQITLNPFTLIGATTRMGLLSAPLRDRFGILLKMAPYSLEELQTLLLASAEKLLCPITREEAAAIAKRARGTPRIANRLLKRFRDLIEIRSIAENRVSCLFHLLGIDEFGFDEQDRRLIYHLGITFQGKAVGLGNLSAMLGEEERTIEEVIEPYLIQEGFLKRTPQGRVATEKARAYCEKALSPEVMVDK